MHNSKVAYYDTCFPEWEKYERMNHLPWHILSQHKKQTLLLLGQTANQLSTPVNINMQIKQ